MDGRRVGNGLLEYLDAEVVSGVVLIEEYVVG